MSTRLILVSDASRARLFRERQSARTYELVASFEHQASRARGRDLATDASGRKPAGLSMGGVTGNVGGRGATPEMDPKAVEAEKFARELAVMLAARLNDHAYDKLVLTAPPQFLGLLKSALSQDVAKHVEGALNKDFTRLQEREIHERIRHDLFVS